LKITNLIPFKPWYGAMANGGGVEVTRKPPSPGLFMGSSAASTSPIPPQFRQVKFFVSNHTPIHMAKREVFLVRPVNDDNDRDASEPATLEQASPSTPAQKYGNTHAYICYLVRRIGQRAVGVEQLLMVSNSLFTLALLFAFFSRRRTANFPGFSMTLFRGQRRLGRNSPPFWTSTTLSKVSKRRGPCNALVFCSPLTF
jgi:hypothetical protein